MYCSPWGLKLSDSTELNCEGIIHRRKAIHYLKHVNEILNRFNFAVIGVIKCGNDYII